MSIYKLLDFSKLPDYIALSESGKRNRLTVHNWHGEKCTFKQTQKEEFNSIQCAYQRLVSLNQSIQSHIAKKYYYGCMP